jgi:hypothetical protein
MSSDVYNGGGRYNRACTMYKLFHKNTKANRGGGEEGHRCLHHTIVLSSLTKMIGKLVNKVRANMDLEI